MNEIKIIQLTQGFSTQVSAEDYDMLMRHSWHITNGGLYAARTESGTSKRIYMHRVINCAPKGMHVHHVDHNTLNNVRSNLQTLTVSQHGAYSRKTSGTSSQFKGVSFCAPRGIRGGDGCWAAHIKFDQKKRHLGHYATEMDAAWRYNLESVKLFGECSKLNVLPLDFLASKPGPTLFIGRGHSKYRGVTWHKAMKKWMAYVCVGVERKHISYHANELDAARAYNENALRIKGDKAKLNVLPMFPVEQTT